MVQTGTDLWQKIADQGVLSVVNSLSDADSMAITERYGAHNYHPMPVNIVRADGVYVWDGSGKQYIDCVGAYSAVAHGHQNPAVVRALIEQLDKIALTSRAFYTTEVALFIQALAEYSELDMVCPMNTGAEAVETCIKLARKWAYKVKGVPEGLAEIIVCNDNFHGRTTTIVGFSTEEQYKDGFGPFTPGFKVIPFGDIDALKAAITPNTAAFLCEPVQAEGGIIIPPDGWMAAVRKLCDENNVLLVWDEVQSGFCRTGRKFAWMYEDAKPDLMCVGKPLGGGLLPVSAAIGSSEVMEMFKPGDHGSTFGGNPLGAAVALAGLAEMETKRYAERSERLGNSLKAAFRAWDIPNIIDVRGRGLLVGVEVAEGVDTERLVDCFLENGILTKETRSRTFRFAPPITIEDAQIDEIVKKAEAAFRSVC